MLPYPHLKPYFLKIGNLEFKWYGLAYALGFLLEYLFLKHFSRQKKIRLSENDILDLLLAGFIGVVVGGRLGYVLIYNLAYFLAHPLKIPAVWEGGMSFHGGLMGTILALLIYDKLKGFKLGDYLDWVIIPAPLGIALAKLGNFINGELIGRATNLPWCMQFSSTDLICRHPSSLYEASKDILIFLILFSLRNKKLPAGFLVWLFLTLYGLLRFTVEFLREPDVQLGFIFGPLTMGQLLSLPMFVIGVGGMLWCIKRLESKKQSL
ncbi:prolipoprotein diacylglyceryl transferase [Candidatus Peregrinibacteria bacterium CG08_land_8_20_14_0_20_41_10]|nr:MAG: prolipoprotein diacylglyceryl transferase [Candidatus Peregrinibacteria bacterium CG08_land_8_20_14_0_20_41_10]